MNQISIENLPDDPSILKSVIAQLAGDVSRLEQMLRLLRGQKFSSKSEMLENPAMRSLFPELENQPKKEDKEQKTTNVTAHTRKTTARKPWPDSLPRRDVHVDLPENERKCQGCGGEGNLKKVSESVSEKLNIIPAKYEVIRYIRPHYSCRSCESMTSKPMPPHPIPKCSASSDTIAHIIVSKFEDGLPLYRQEKIFARHGCFLPRDKMARWIIKVAEKAQPLVNLMDNDLLTGNQIQIDETGLQVLKEKGRKATTKSFLIVKAREGPPGKSICLFHYNPSRSKEVMASLLGDFKGTLLSDGLRVYNALCQDRAGIRQAGCFSHVRRKFVEAQKGLPPAKRKVGLSGKAIELIDKLFAIEKSAKGLPAAEILTERQEKSAPIIEELHEWLLTNIDLVPKKSLTGMAMGYLMGQWPKLTTFLNDGNIAIHNNFVENLIRNVALGRKAWLFATSTEGAHASASLYSLLVTAKLNGLNPYEYMVNLLQNLPVANTEADYRVLLPYS